ncbi:BTAD domain-containing putative transcriptional regulator [Micromonospora sp. NPDC000089]|uniref:AfsR/SARP family transcriptional regulator n=1 Tax=unclassified Micromonospora TaxID=2617518 RepID=UPI003680987A
MLAVLLAEAGHPVTRDRLVHEIWGERPTRTATTAVNGYIMRVRRLLRAGDAGDVVGHPAGYQLVAGEDTVDLQVFERMVRTGKRYAAEGRMAGAARQLTGGLALWRGPAFADVPATPTVTAEACRAEQLRLAAYEERFGAQLELGQHAEIVDELSALVRDNPLRERLGRHLMTALYRCGRRAEALDAYRRVRDVLVTETGLEPGPELRGLERAVLSDDRALAAPAVRSVIPAQLPAAVADFAGRREVLARLDSLARQRPTPPVVIAGLAGVGKTALAVRWGHSVRDRFPDGLLYLDLRGSSPLPPVTPMAALAHFLQALGVPPEEVPTELDEAVGLYRSVTAARRILVVLDNAQRPDQVRPLLPGGPGCLALVTSREQLRGLTAREGAVGIRLGVLTPPEAAELLDALLPAAAEEGAELARLCGYLPLAIRIAVANLLAEMVPVGQYNQRLAAGDRLAALGVPGDATTATVTAFDLSYQAHPPAARRLFRLAAVAPGDTVTVPGAAALVDVPAAEAEALLDALVRAHLLEQAGRGRYGWHDLVRLYARRRCAAEDADRWVALDRLHHYYLSSMDAAATLLCPHVVRLPLPATVGTAHRAPAGQLARLANLGNIRLQQGRLAESVAYCERTIALERALPDWHGQGTAHGCLGEAHLLLGRPAEAMTYLTEALATHRRTRSRSCEADTLRLLAAAHTAAGGVDEAQALATEALRIAREVGDLWVEAHAQLAQAELDLRVGDAELAVDHLGQVLTLARPHGARHAEAQALIRLAQAERLRGPARADQARAYATQALAMCREFGYGLLAEQASTLLG